METVLVRTMSYKHEGEIIQRTGTGTTEREQRPQGAIRALNALLIQQ